MKKSWIYRLSQMYRDLSTSYTAFLLMFHAKLPTTLQL